MSLVNKNILANILGRIWSILSVFIFIPLYITILGVKIYGVVSFYAILQGILIFADAGLTATLKRELAKGNNSEESREYKFKILRSIELIYLLIVFVITSLIFFGSNYIVDSWLNIEDLDKEATVNGIKIMAFALGLNFLSKPYQGALIGMEKQVLSNLLQFLWGLLKNGGVVLAIYYLNNTLEIFFGWQLVVNLAYVLALRFLLLKLLYKKNKFHWKFKRDFKVLNKVWKYALGMLIISIIAALNSQFDKILISKYFSVSELGIYTLAYSLAMIPVILSGPIATAIFPKLVNYHDNDDVPNLEKLFKNSFKMVLLLT
ncbi:MAG: oligosaccharide flippase family protein, partial [Mesoflavibacter sp.]|nr:oligosaccharide flippase family protein [Mesoflavibacter sp.]